MITNERQYKITKTQMLKFKDALKEFSEINLARSGIDPIIISAQRKSLEQQLADLQRDVERYEWLQSGEARNLTLADIAEIGLKLIEARIVQGLSQRELAERLGMKEQQVQRYEQERYLSASLARCAEVAAALCVDLHAELKVQRFDLLDQLLPKNVGGGGAIDVSKFPIAEMRKRGWFEQFAKTRPVESYKTDAEIAAAFLHSATGGQNSLSLHKQNIRSGSKQDQYALAAWKAMVLLKARDLGDMQNRGGGLDVSVIKKLAELSEQPEGPQQAVALLRQHGVAIVFVEHLPGTHLDGAAMLLDGRVPVIGMTLRQNRLDNFWFVLMHECAHIVMHRERGLKDGFFDEEQASTSDIVETEADEFASNALIPDEVWKRSLVRFSSSPEQVVQFARRNHIGSAVVAGRIRRERRDYALFSEMVGQGEPKKLISAAGFWEA